MMMGFISTKPQPNTGIQVSSRLATYTCHGKIFCKASVSQPDWCLEQITEG